MEPIIDSVKNMSGVSSIQRVSFERILIKFRDEFTLYVLYKEDDLLCKYYTQLNSSDQTLFDYVGLMPHSNINDLLFEVDRMSTMTNRLNGPKHRQYQ